MNVVFKAIRNDNNIDRAKALIKRCLQICFIQKPAFICGMLLIVSELMKHRPQLKDFVTKPENHDPEAAYDPTKREPLGANAQNAGWWELTLLATHSHPSVSKWAQMLLEGTPVLYDGDPLNDFSLAAFLDKFINKKPKKFKEDLQAKKDEDVEAEVEEDNVEKFSDEEDFDSIFEESDDEENIDLEKKLEKMLVEDEGVLDDALDDEEVGGLFASVDDFQHLLEASGMEDERMKKQEKWEQGKLRKKKRKRT